jgi:hypothetical protein
MIQIERSQCFAIQKHGGPRLKKRAPVSEQLRRELRRVIRETGSSQYAIAAATNGAVSRFSLSRFLSGGNLRLESIDALGAVVGLDVKARCR